MKPNKPNKPDRPNKLERPNRPNRLKKPNRPNKPDRPSSCSGPDPCYVDTPSVIPCLTRNLLHQQRERSWKKSVTIRGRDPIE